ncbi:MAG: 6-bladed beta-propeller [Tannerella sp.]|jgi:hypothetical protein|nr:6-bladed beta-propeller [Tannerella sp.]
MKKYFYLFVLIGCISCAGKEQSEEPPYFMKIGLPNSILSLPPLRLSEFADSIEYLQLETTDECLLRHPSICLRDDNFLFYSDISRLVYKFDATTGHFLGQIGEIGQGPGEYVWMKNAFIDKDNNKIIVQDGGKQDLMVYDYDGHYIDKMLLTKDSIFTTYAYSTMLIDIDSQYIVYKARFMPAAGTRQPHEVMVSDYKTGKIIHSIPNRLDGIEGNAGQFKGSYLMLKQSDAIFYKSFYNDTLYTVHKKEGINPYAIIDLGSRKPNGIYFSNDFALALKGSILITGCHINRNCILLNCMLPHTDTFQDVYRFICKYDKATGHLTYHSEKIINDIDGGFNIGVLSLHLSLHNIFSVPFPSDIEESVKDVVFSTLDKSELKYPERKDQFEHMQEQRNPDDNPLLMFLHWKE